MDWHHPDYLPRMKFEEESRPSEGHNVMDYIAYMREQLHQILTEYSPAPFVLWYDGGWMTAPEALGAAETNALARKWHPGLLINDRHHTKEDLITPEQRVPATGILDDNGEPFTQSPDPMLEELKKVTEGFTLSGNNDYSKLRGLYSREDVFGVNLYEVGLGEKIEGMVAELYAGRGAVRKTLKKYVNP